MITIHEFLPIYCKERNLEPPTHFDLENCGRIINKHFKDYWCPKQPYKIGETIPDSGFVLTLENGRKFIIQAYPEAFKPEMSHCCDRYYYKKNTPSVPPENPPQPQPKKLRKRAKFPVKVASFKPSNLLGQNTGQSDLK